MTMLVVGSDCAVARALRNEPPPIRMNELVAAIEHQRPSELVIIALPTTAGPVGALTTEDLGSLIGRTVTVGFVATKLAAQLDHPVRVVVVCTANGVLPDHLDGARAVASAGLTMLTEVCSPVPNLTINTIAVADDVPVQEVADTVRWVLTSSSSSLNGATIRLDGGRDAVLAAETRAEED